MPLTAKCSALLVITQWYARVRQFGFDFHLFQFCFIELFLAI